MGPAGAAATFDTRAIAASSNISAGVTRITTLGRAAVGDLGGADYIYYGPSAPAHAGYVATDSNTKFWVLDPKQIIRPEMFGAFGDGATYNDSAFAALGTYLQATGGGFRLHFKPGGVYLWMPVIQGTSTTGNDLASIVGTKTFTTQTGKAWFAGQLLLAQAVGAPSPDPGLDFWLYGTVNSYNSGTGVLVMSPTGYGYTTSSSLVTVGTGAQTFNIGANKAYIAGHSVRVTQTQNLSVTAIMNGTVSSYNPGTGDLVVNVTSVTGSGAYNSWEIVRTDTISNWKINAAGGSANQPFTLTGLQPFEIVGNNASIYSKIAVPNQYKFGNIVSCYRPSVIGLRFLSDYVPIVGSSPGFPLFVTGMTGFYTQACYMPVFDLYSQNFAQTVSVQNTGLGNTYSARIKVECDNTVYPVDGEGWQGYNEVIIKCSGAHRAFASYDFKGDLWVTRSSFIGQDVYPDDVVLNSGSGSTPRGECICNVTYIDLDSTDWGSSAVVLQRFNATSVWAIPNVFSNQGIATSLTVTLPTGLTTVVPGTGLFIKDKDYPTDYWVSGKVTNYNSSTGSTTVDILTWAYTESLTPLSNASAGAKTFTTQTGRAYAPGQSFVARSTNTVGVFLSGTVTSYNSTTGALVVNVTSVGGTFGTYADWRITRTDAMGSAVTPTWQARVVEPCLMNVNIRIVMRGPTSTATRPTKLIYGRLIGETHPYGDDIQVVADVAYYGDVPTGAYAIDLFRPEPVYGGVSTITTNVNNEALTRIKYDVKINAPSLKGDQTLGTLVFGLDSNKGGKLVADAAPGAKVQRYNRDTLGRALPTAALQTMFSKTADGQPVVTGSKGGNVALTNLINVLANTYGIITDTTT